MEITNNLKREIVELQKQIQELQASLTEERVSNLEFDQTQKEQKIKIEQLTDALAKEKLKNQALSQQIQELQIQTDEKTHNFQQYIAQQHQQIIVQNNYINQLQLQMSTHHQQNNENESDGFAKYGIKFDEDSMDSPHDEHSQELRHGLLDEQMRHEQLKDHELNVNTSGNDQLLKDEIESLRVRLVNEKTKRENLDKERRNSLAALSQNMFKKLLDSEHQHYDDKSDLEKQCHQLKLIIKHLEKSKQTLLQECCQTINDLREHIKLLSHRLQKYENW